jgi:hypothetical protein
MSESNYHNRFDKDIVTKRPNKVRVDDIAKASTDRLCSCPGNEPGKVKIDIDEHIPGCRFRKRSSQYATKMSVIPRNITDGCSLGAATGLEDF